MTPSYPEYASPSIAAKVYGVKPPTLRRWAKTGKIGFILTPGGQYRYDVRSHLALMSVASAPQPVKAPKPDKAITAKQAKAAVLTAAIMPEKPEMTAEQIAAMQALLAPKPRPAMPEGVELRDIDAGPDVQMREWNPEPRPVAKPAPAKPAPAKAQAARKPPPAKLSKEELARQLEALAG